MSSPLAIDARQMAIVRETLLKHLPVDTTVYVYGSRAKGRARRMSDLDLALCAQDPIPSEIMADLAEAFDESDLPWKVDLIDWATTSDRFRAIIAPDLRVLVQGRLSARGRARSLPSVCGVARTAEDMLVPIEGCGC